MASEIEDLVRIHPPARASFSRARDVVEGNADEVALIDWMTLNGILGQDERTLDWFDTLAGEGRSGALLDRVGWRLVPLLERESRWADIGRLFVDPAGEVAGWHQGVSFARNQTRSREILEPLVHSFRERAGELYRCVLAAGRIEAAEEVKRTALRLEPGAATAQVFDRGEMSD